MTGTCTDTLGTVGAPRCGATTLQPN